LKEDWIRIYDTCGTHQRSIVPFLSTWNQSLPEGAPVPVNKIKVQLNPHPWLEKASRVERYNRVAAF